MQLHFKSTVLTLVFMMALSSCVDYSGEGELTDHGILDANHRYTLDLGSLEVGVSGKKEFRLIGLPSTEFVVGVSLTQNHPFDSIENNKLLVGVLALRLIREGGGIVIDEEAPLSEWVWSHGTGFSKVFLYRRGKLKEIKNSDSFRYERIGVKFDGGWGTYFTPASDASYKLYVSIQSKGGSNISVRIEAESSGWK